MTPALRGLCLGMLVICTACGRVGHIGRPPALSPVEQGAERAAMTYVVPADIDARPVASRASLWNGGRRSLLGDRRALQQGDILTVVIEIDEEAEISNRSERNRSGSESLGIPQLFGVPQKVDKSLPDGATLGDAVSITGGSSASGDGTVRRNEKLTLRVAATVVDVLPNGVLAISGTQEVRVNFELRELLVTGYVRPEDISRLNEITYDKIASARISYGGRGQISDMQQPRIGQQVLDAVLPF
ncbi:flagellar basal body L-ring protein FlgH [Roseivivax isoporae]|uniref:Flagellar L-ring protein n=1 Tax=Roseivivax isoporae LMG 25204 TaxID=1449351 RepID=X7FAE0_9RHOB|nr:flagellar basal body L-ring protein FlgH [Roseivivax isoporae]ETX29688.1 flagellar L-ring protein FlgH [Roseivivax isoporae LMG 25204]